VDYRQHATPFYRAYNPSSDYHFFTTSLAEFRNAVQFGYRDETAGNSGFSVLKNTVPGVTPLFRLYNLHTGRHYYTTNPAERDALVALIPPPVGPDTRTSGWRSETVEGYLFTDATPLAVPIFRLYNQATGTHLYTESPAIRDAILSRHPGVWVEHAPLGFAYPSDDSGQDTPRASQPATLAVASPPSTAQVHALNIAPPPPSTGNAGQLLAVSGQIPQELASRVATPASSRQRVPDPASTQEPEVLSVGPRRRTIHEQAIDSVYLQVFHRTEHLDALQL
jgi:hypothetical protein